MPNTLATAARKLPGLSVRTSELSALHIELLLALRAAEAILEGIPHRDLRRLPKCLKAARYNGATPTSKRLLLEVMLIFKSGGTVVMCMFAARLVVCNSEQRSDE